MHWCFAVGESRGSPGRDRYNFKTGSQKFLTSVCAVCYVLWMAKTYSRGNWYRVRLYNIFFLIKGSCDNKALFYWSLAVFWVKFFIFVWKGTPYWLFKGCWFDRSFSAPLTALFFLCFGSELVEGAWELLAVGGLRLARSFLCLSISSLCWFTHSCCLHKNKRKRKLTFHFFSQLKHENTLVKHEKSYNINL